MAGDLIEQLKEGSRPTFLETIFANTIIKIINALQNMVVRYSDTNQVVYGDTDVIIQIQNPKEFLDKSDTPPFKVSYPLEWSKDGGKWLLSLDAFTRNIRYCSTDPARNSGNLLHIKRAVRERVFD